MAISATTSGKDRILRESSMRSVFEDARELIDATVTFYEGDILKIDTTNHLIKPVAATGDADVVLGIAVQTVKLGKLVSPFSTDVDAAQAISAVAGPVFGVEANMKLKSGDVFVSGGKVYLVDGGDCQTVTSTDPGDGKAIGIYTGPAVTAGATSEGPCAIGCRYPAAALVL